MVGAKQIFKPEITVADVVTETLLPQKYVTIIRTLEHHPVPV